MTREPDTAALERAVSHRQVVAFRSAEHTDWRWNDQAGLATGGAIVFGSLFGLLPWAIVGLIDLSGRPVAVPDLARFGPSVVLVVSVLWVLLVRRGAWGAWERRLRFAGFATANGLAYTEAIDATDYPGAVFQHGTARERFGFFRSLRGPTIEYGGYRWTTGFGKYSTTHLVGYVATRLARPLPAMMLDAGIQPGLLSIDPLRRVTRPGRAVPLDAGVTLWCDPEDEAAARRVFTRDIATLLARDPLRIDVELVDGWLFLYTGQPFDARDPETWRRLFAVREHVAAAVDAELGRGDGGATGSS